MSKEYFSIKLSEIAEVVAGQSPESIYYSNIKGVPFLQGNRTFGTLYPSIDTYTSKVTKIARKDEVLMSVRAPVGDLNFAPCDLCIGRGLASIKAKNGNNKFIYYALKYNIKNLLRQGSGTTFDSVNKDVINDFELIIPKDISARNEITKILSALDSKIELNNRINAELEAMAKTLYDYWFVQFDFPNANGKPYKSTGGKMVWNEELKREIPEGWEVKDLENIESNIVTGKTPSTLNESYFNGDVPFICIGDVRGNMHIVETQITLTKEGAETQSNKFIPKGSICVTCIASPGLVAFATEASQTNQQLNSVVCKKLENRYYLYFYLTDYFKYAKAKTGNTFANMNKGDFASIKVVKPQKDILINFTNLLDSSIDKILTNSLENQKLTELRDWLLPMLMNGQVKVMDKMENELSMAAEAEVTYKKSRT
jgi:type I restriction enzyme S subunit